MSLSLMEKYIVSFMRENTGGRFTQNQLQQNVFKHYEILEYHP